MGAGGTWVPIYRLLGAGAFEPEMITMRGVFEDVLRTLGLVDRQDPLTTMIARKVIELAQDGERDPDRLKQLTLSTEDPTSCRLFYSPLHFLQTQISAQ